jgi:alpha-beta hydrolase superfamily lysophospholipase
VQVSDLSYHQSPRVTERGPLSQDGQPALYYRWAPAESSKATVLILHGYGEHSGRYEHVLEALVEAGFSGLAIDYRGYGLAEGRRGCLRDFEEYVTDALRGLRLAGHKKGPDEPLFLLGHSQGGLLALRVAMEEGLGLSGLMLSSPWLGMAMKVPTWKYCIAKLASRFVPDFGLSSDIPKDWITTDAEQVALRDADPLMVHTGSARWLTEIYRTQEVVRAGAASVTLPTLLMAAGDDRLVSTPESRRVFEALGAPDSTWIEYPGLRHEIFNELERRRVFVDMTSWLLERVRKS